MLKATNNGEKYYNSGEFDECSKYYGRNKVRNAVVGVTRSFFNYIDPSEDACRSQRCMRNTEVCRTLSIKIKQALSIK